MIKISNIKYPLQSEESNLPKFVAKKYDVSQMRDFRIVRKSIDARKKDDIHFVYTVEISCDNERNLIKRNKNISVASNKYYALPKRKGAKKNVVVVGFGPAGIMAAYALATSGYSVIVLERGEEIEKRQETVDKLRNKGELNPESNIQFGEGGAGTFSDGKLTTGVNDERIPYILNQFVKHGAPPEIEYQSKPHIGTDKLVNMVKNFRSHIIEMGGEIRFSNRLTNINTKNGKIKSVTVLSSDGEYELPTDYLVLATGHSARDVYKMLKRNNVKLERKVFAVGLRIEHLQSKINEAQYGELGKILPAADYKLSVKTSSGRSVYTFCMCPGGEVVASASEEGGVVTNGMSAFARDTDKANSALLVNVMPSDLRGDDVLEGCNFQREIEKKAFNISNSFRAPYQTVGDFLYNNDATPIVQPSYKPGVVKADISEVLPEFVVNALREGIPLLDKKLNGFADEGAILIAPETRSSSPVRILRDSESYMCNIDGIYPCGEGAGYAGGITTSAIDGLKIAEKIITRE